MEVEKEFAGFVLPFAAATATAVCSGSSAALASPIPASASFALTCISVAILLYMVCHGVRSYRARVMMTVLTGFFCGLTCGFSGLELATTDMSSAVRFMQERFGSVLKSSVDKIGFDDPRVAALVKALATGDRSGMPESLYTTFRDSGASHILALSGLHLGMVYGMISKLLSILGNGRVSTVIRSIMSVTLCGIYSLSVGASPSILRALLFIITAEAARLMFRKKDTGTLLLTALTIHLTIAPASIASIGFQLSYAAIAAIAWIYPHISRLWPAPDSGKMRRSFNIMQKIWDIAALSISCQMTAGTAAWLRFGTFPKYFLITNLTALPISTVLIPGSLIAVMLSGMGICPEILKDALEWTASLLIRTLEIVSTM